jgi:hypothetical protein
MSAGGGTTSGMCQTTRAGATACAVPLPPPPRPHPRLTVSPPQNKILSPLQKKAANITRCGNGKLSYCDGSAYQGQWRNDLLHGHGILEQSEARRLLRKGEAEASSDPSCTVPRTVGISDAPGHNTVVWETYDGQWSNSRRKGKGLCTYVF